MICQMNIPASSFVSVYFLNENENANEPIDISIILARLIESFLKINAELYRDI